MRCLSSSKLVTAVFLTPSVRCVSDAAALVHAAVGHFGWVVVGAGRWQTPSAGSHVMQPCSMGYQGANSSFTRLGVFYDRRPTSSYVATSAKMTTHRA